MTTTISPPEATAVKPLKGRAATKGSVAVALPQVNLLPPEIRAARGLRAVKRWLLASIGLVAVLLVAVFVWSVMDRAAAQDALAGAQAETARLQAEERQYAEVPLVLGRLDSTRTAREVGMSTEVAWKPYLDAVAAVLPGQVSIDSVSLSGATPMTLPPAPASPLEEPAVGLLAFTGRTMTVPDAAAWLDALNGIPGLADAWVSSAAIDGPDGTTSYYVVTATVRVTDDALAERFAEAEATSEEN